MGSGMSPIKPSSLLVPIALSHSGPDARVSTALLMPVAKSVVTAFSCQQLFGQFSSTLSLDCIQFQGKLPFFANIFTPSLVFKYVL
eukprot:8178143-Heterocapsa_arctica.AAC.1